jgi:hypothetical protein
MSFARAMRAMLDAWEYWLWTLQSDRLGITARTDSDADSAARLHLSPALQTAFSEMLDHVLAPHMHLEHRQGGARRPLAIGATDAVSVAYAHHAHALLILCSARFVASSQLVELWRRHASHRLHQLGVELQNKGQPQDLLVVLNDPCADPMQM